MKRRELHSLLAILVTIFVITCRVYPQKKLVECDGLIRMLCNQSTYLIICIMIDCYQGLHSMKKAPIYMFISDIAPLCCAYSTTSVHYLWNWSCCSPLLKISFSQRALMQHYFKWSWSSPPAHFLCQRTLLSPEMLVQKEHWRLHVWAYPKLVDR